MTDELVPPPVPGPAPASPKQPQPKRFGFVALGLVAVVAGVAGMVIGGVATSVGQGAATTAATSAVSEPAAPEPTEEDTQDPEPAGYKPKRSDWGVAVKTRDKHCYGSAGCNVTVKIEPVYVGEQDLPDSGTIEVYYRLYGDDSGPITGSFTVTDSQIHYTEETDLSTKSRGVKVTSKITDVTYSEE